MTRFFAFSFLVFFLFCAIASAQSPSKSQVSPCGTPPGIDPWLRVYHERPQDFAASRSTDTLYVGVQVHLLAKDNGIGRISSERLLDAFCRLNQDYEASAVRFFFADDWNPIDSTGWYQHNDILDGIDMMFSNNIPGVLNCYFTSVAAGTCGYNLPYAGIVIMHGCAGPNDHTWSHEIGHALSLPHPFIGWEDTNYNFGNPTPLWLTYDYTHFHDTLDTQIPAPLDTALVEFVDGSNCDIAADLICDTKPDYLNNGWDCDDEGNSLTVQKDPSGALFKSDGTLFMSYAFDKCQNRFSDEQIAILRANLQTEKAEWLADFLPGNPVTALPELISPLNGELSPEIGTVLHWSPVPNATHYLVQYSRLASFLTKEFEAVTTDTSIVLGDLLVNNTYYWRVRPFNYAYVCQDFSPKQSFKTAPLTAVSGPDADGWRCYPSLLAPGNPVTLEMPASWANRTALCAVYNSAGSLMWEQTLTAQEQPLRVALPSAHWPAGVYRLLCAGEKGLKTQTLVLGGG